MDLITTANTDINKLWVNISGFGDGNIFAIYPKLLSQLFRESAGENDRKTFAFIEKAILPSDKDWRMKIYYQLVEKQREKTRVPSAWTSANTDQDKLLSNVFVPNSWDTVGQSDKKREKCRLESETSITTKTGNVDWSVKDIIKAGALLAVPPIDIEFEHEQEMRRVFSLVYDVLRYKNILNQALKDVSFFTVYPELQNSTAQVWLLLYDLYHRKFTKRDPQELEQIKKTNYGLIEVDKALWRYRIKLAASVSRLRIKNSALRLSQLLPPHLQDERVANAAECTSVTCWVNTFIVREKQQIVDILHNNEFIEFDEKQQKLGVNDFRWDPICPQFVSFHPSQRATITQFQLVKQNNMIVQDRAFCLGPATFHKLLTDFELCGSVIQTHINSPRATAYLGSLLSQNENILKLHAFGAGSRKEEFENYMNNVGADNIKVYAERLIDISPDSTFLEHVTAVFATPPNSYSAVMDPIDLVCSRGGDLSMLQVLTESDINEEGRKRVAAILEEQRLTLKYAMSRPQIQFVLYETHSVVEAENQHMVKRVLYEMNRFTRERHAEQQGKLITVPYKTAMDSNLMDINNNSDNDVQNSSSEAENEKDDEDDTLDQEMSEQMFASTIYKRFSLLSEKLELDRDPYRNIVVPDCDLFEEGPLPEICATTDCCAILKEEGCYLALLKRKELTHLNDKYMINVAETRGLFGEEAKEIAPKKSGSKQSGKLTKKKDDRSLPAIHKAKKRLSNEVDIIARIAAPTAASLYRRKLYSQNNSEDNLQYLCPRHFRPQTSPQECRARRWWNETTHHIISYHNNEKNIKNSKINDNKIDNNRLNLAKCDKMLTCSDSCLSHPPLRLTRSSVRRKKKIAVPLHINTVIMPKFARLI